VIPSFHEPVLAQQFLLGFLQGLVGLLQLPRAFPKVFHEVLIAAAHHVGHRLEDRDGDLGVVLDDGLKKVYLRFTKSSIEKRLEDSFIKIGMPSTIGK